MSLEAIPFEIRQLARYRAQPLDFFRECVFTQDQADKAMPVKPFPIREGDSRKDYLEYMILEMINEPLLAAVKHRRMTITWAYCGVTLWDAMLHEGRFNALQSKKEEDSDELVRRCKFIWENIPEDRLPLKPKALYKYATLKFPDQDSEIKGVASGPDQLRQFTCSRVGCDEIAFWQNARTTFTALKPTLEGGGKVCLISTRYPGFFKQLIEDTIDDEAAA